MYSKLNKTNNPKPPSVEESQKSKSKKYKQIIKYISYTNKHLNNHKSRSQTGGNNGKRWRKPYNNHRENLIAGGGG
jgi:hypothetical protein